MKREAKNNRTEKWLPHINFRPALFCAVALAGGVCCCGKLLFGQLNTADIVFFAIFLAFSLPPLFLKRSAAVVICFALSFCVGAGVLLLSSNDYFNTVSAGEYRLFGTAVSVNERNGYTSVTLDYLAIDGENTKGKCVISLGEDVEIGDMVMAKVVLTPISERSFQSGAELGYFAEDIRYFAKSSEYEVTGQSAKIFLKANRAISQKLKGNMNRDEASVAFALLTGNSGNVDGSLLLAIREGGIAHIFAVSGLHIGVLYAAAYALFAPLKRYRFLPATLAAFAYAGLCGFTVSAVRAAIMCGVAGAVRATGRKTDFLSSISFAALLCLLFMPKQWFSSGFQLSFGACLGLALFSGSLSRFFQKFLPKIIGGGLATGISVQIFTFPVMMQTFGYVSVWGLLLNLILIPLMPVLFLGLIACLLFSFCIPPAAAFFLAFPQSMLSALLYVFSVSDFSFVLTGFSLGAGGVIWLVGCIFISQRFRLKTLWRAISCSFIALCFSLALLLQNGTLGCCKISVYSQNGSSAALVRSHGESVLIIDGDISLAACQSFLANTYGGKLNKVIVVAKDEMSGCNVAAFLGAEQVHLKEEHVTGFRQTNVVFGEEITCGSLNFYYESKEKLLLITEDCLVEFDFTQKEALSSHLFIGEESGNCNYYLKSGRVRAK